VSFEEWKAEQTGRCYEYCSDRAEDLVNLFEEYPDIIKILYSELAEKISFKQEQIDKLQSELEESNKIHEVHLQALKRIRRERDDLSALLSKTKDTCEVCGCTEFLCGHNRR
jgi:DNA repair exonuclease SbcCD ATPase subunit